MNYRCDLHERMAKADWQRRRYWECGETRLHRVNMTRKRRGKQPYSSLGEVPPRGHAARSQPRNAGRFV